MSAYYNEFDPYAARWLRNLIAAGHIPAGDVDERSIVDVSADDLRGYTQCHFFAGIGGWPLALRLAGWPDGRPVWTGSCPCQPFSTAGAQRGSEDARHLWPTFFALIRECGPASVFGEQVAGANGLAWLDHVCADLEGVGYAAAAADLPAGGVGAAHRRQRLFWVAHAAGKGRAGLLRNERGVCEGAAKEWAAIALDTCRATEIREGGETMGESPFLMPADGLSKTVGRLRAYGNAIVPQVAAEFVRAAA